MSTELTIHYHEGNPTAPYLAEMWRSNGQSMRLMNDRVTLNDEVRLLVSIPSKREKPYWVRAKVHQPESLAAGSYILHCSQVTREDDGVEFGRFHFLYSTKMKKGYGLSVVYE